MERIRLSDQLSLTRIIPGLMRVRQWGYSSQDLLNWIHACLDMGITSFDHADIYGSYLEEAIFGEALALEPSLRPKLELVTKCGIALLSENRPAHTVHHYNTTRAHILTSVDNALRNLQTDYLDVLLIHRPDPLMNADDVASALHEVLQVGKVRHVGVSNFLPFHFDLLQSRLDVPLVTNQIEFSVSHMAPLFDGTLDQAQQLRHAPMIWSPLGGGSLFTSQDPKSMRIREALDTIARAHHATPDQIALAWIMQHPTKPMPVLGTGKLARIQSAVDACAITLELQEWFAIWEASMGHDVP